MKQLASERLANFILGTINAKVTKVEPTEHRGLLLGELVKLSLLRGQNRLDVS